MTPNELLIAIDHLLEDAKAALLATIGPDGRPHLRWMTPRRLKATPHLLTTVSEASAAKVAQIRLDPRVTWIVQTASLNEIVTIEGRARVIDDPTALQEFLEAAGKDLFMVWHLHPAATHPHLVVIETEIDTATRLDSRTGATEHFTFSA